LNFKAGSEGVENSLRMSDGGKARIERSGQKLNGIAALIE
jgi:hypothetical protein